MIAQNCCGIVLGLYYACTFQIRGSPNLPFNLHLGINRLFVAIISNEETPKIQQTDQVGIVV
jgi:hypothetical protein